MQSLSSILMTLGIYSIDRLLSFNPLEQNLMYRLYSKIHHMHIIAGIGEFCMYLKLNSGRRSDQTTIIQDFHKKLS